MVGAALELDWTTTGGLGLPALSFLAFAFFHLTFLGLSSKEGDLPRDLLGMPMARLDSRALAMTFFSLYFMGTSSP